VTEAQTQFYVNLLSKVRETPDWREYLEKGAFNTTSLTGADFRKWLEGAEAMHRRLMTEAGFLAK
jgi:tripartite-type tricarboxylate transporter receptor subunit TctC